MGDKPKAEVPFTFVTKVLQSYIDRINDIDKKAHFDTTTDTRKKIDKLLGEFQEFWRTNYNYINEIYGKEIAEFFQEKVLTYFIENTKRGFDSVISVYIAHDWSKREYENFENRVLKEKRLRDYLA